MEWDVILDRHKQIDDEQGKYYGLSKREVEEFNKKMNRDRWIRKDFSLDISSAKTPEYFEEKIKNA